VTARGGGRDSRRAADVDWRRRDAAARSARDPEAIRRRRGAARRELRRGCTTWESSTATTKAGTIEALVAQYPYGIGQLGVQLAYKYVTGNRSGIKKHYGTGSAVVTRANVNSPAIKKYLYMP